MPNMLPANESLIFSQKDMGFRLEKWGSGHDQSRALLITGHSGSGKTTLAKELCQKYNARLVSLDWFDFFITNPRRPGDPNYAEWKFFTDCVVETGCNKSTRSFDHRRRVQIFGQAWQIFMEKISKKPDLWVAEGIQVINLMEDIPDPTTLPIIVKGTSAVSSVNRRMTRDNKYIPDSNGRAMSRISAYIEWAGIEKTNKRFMGRLLATGTPQPVNL